MPHRIRSDFLAIDGSTVKRSFITKYTKSTTK
jgi:hypothetical protein